MDKITIGKENNNENYRATDHDENKIKKLKARTSLQMKILSVLMSKRLGIKLWKTTDKLG